MDSWIRKLIKSQFHYSFKYVDMELGFKIKNNNIPDKLYKYRPFNEYSKSALNSNQLWFSSPQNFNDIFDTQVNFNPGLSIVDDLSVDQVLNNVEAIKEGLIDEKKQYEQKISNPITFEEHLRKMFAEVQKMYPNQIPDELCEVLQEILDKYCNEMVSRMSGHLRSGYSVLSLSANENNNLMWSHYADAHKGFCIEYDFSKLAIDHDRRRMCYPVLYRKNPINVSRYLNNRDVSFNNFFGIYACLTKSVEWEYEKEWRIVHPLGQQYANSLVHMPQASSIILGANIEADNEKWMLDFCSSRAIELKKSKIIVGKNSTVIERVQI